MKILKICNRINELFKQIPQTNTRPVFDWLFFKVWWMVRWVNVKAVLRIAYSKQKIAGGWMYSTFWGREEGRGEMCLQGLLTIQCFLTRVSCTPGDAWSSSRGSARYFRIIQIGIIFNFTIVNAIANGIRLTAS